MAVRAATLKFRKFVLEALDFLHVSVYNRVCLEGNAPYFLISPTRYRVNMAREEKGDPDMGTYSFETLIRKWGLGELTTEQAIGQILLILQELIRRMEALEGRGEGANRKRSSRKG
jgi:hypothetical protein